MRVIIDEATRMKEPNFLVGYAIIQGVSVGKTQNLLKKEIMSVIHSVRDKYNSREEMYGSVAIKEMRDLFKKNGIDPTRYTPSAEALLKRIIDGKDLYRINNIVECNNMGSMRFELPMGVYDLDKLVGDVVFKFGSDSDTMDTMAKGTMGMKNILLTMDDEKLFGSPVSDSPHAMITESVRNVLLLVYGTSGVGREEIASATKYTAQKIAEHSGGIVSKLEVIASE
jgi:DNA/RNA-binding domain of Phe-tRNA-synthetase-like protein